MLKDLADARTFWTANILVASIDTDCNDKSGWSPSLPFLTPSSFSRHPSSFVPSLWHLPRGGLYIWGIKENSFCSRWVKQTQFFLCQQLSVIQPELSVLHRGPSRSTAYNPDNNGAMSEFITSMKQKMANLKEEIEAMRPGTEERKTGIREWRELSRGAMQMVSSRAMYALSSFHRQFQSHTLCSLNS